MKSAKLQLKDLRGQKSGYVAFFIADDKSLVIEVQGESIWKAYRKINLSHAQEGDITYRQISNAFAHSADIASTHFQSGYFDVDDDKPYPALFAMGLVGFEMYLSAARLNGLRIRLYVENQLSGRLYRLQGYISLREAEEFGVSLALLLDER